VRARPPKQTPSASFSAFYLQFLRGRKCRFFEDASQSQPPLAGLHAFLLAFLSVLRRRAGHYRTAPNPRQDIRSFFSQACCLDYRLTRGLRQSRAGAAPPRIPWSCVPFFPILLFGSCSFEEAAAPQTKLCGSPPPQGARSWTSFFF